MEQTSENRFRSSKKLKIIASTILQLLVIACMQFTPVFADETGVMPPTGGDDDLGGGLDGTENTGAVGNGFRHIDGGYRCYMEDENGAIVQQVVDFYFDNLASDQFLPMAKGYTTYHGKRTALGGKFANSAPVPYSTLEQLIPGLKPPLWQHAPWGNNLTAWFESENSHSTIAGATNADLFILQVFTTAGDDATELLYNYMLGNYRIVVEGVYWYNLVNPEGLLILDQDDQPRYVYGTVRDFAKFNSIKMVNEMISNHPERRVGGEWLGRYTNGACATALMLVETDEFSGFGPPTLSPDYGGDRYSYDTILTPKQGWDMHVVYKERASEKWATWDSTKYGGYQEASPGVAPKQPEIPGVDNTKIHPVTIIKYYELEKVERDSSGKKKTVYETVTGPTRQTKICTTIDVQTEPGWILRRHFQAKSDVHAAKWLDISSSIKYKQRFGASTVEMEVESGYKYLYVWHVKVDNTPPAI